MGQRFRRVGLSERSRLVSSCEGRDGPDRAKVVMHRPGVKGREGSI